MRTKTRKSFFERIRIGLEEGIAHAKGELTLHTIEIPDEPPEIDAPTLVALRKEAKMSQAVFARVLSVSPKTVQSWEQGVRVSSESARRLIHVFAQQPDVVCQIVGLPKVQLYGFKIVEKKKGKRQIVRALRAPRPEHGPNDRG